MDRDKIYERNRLRRVNHKLAGICVDCSTPAIDDKVRCDAHLRRKREIAKTVPSRKNISRNLRLDAILAYGGKCVCCGISNIEFLTLDHINNDGAAHREQVHDVHRWAKISGYPSDVLQVLCANCHLAKTYWITCPHKI